MKTIKDLPKGTNLDGIRVKTPNGVIGLWRSQWIKGVWLTVEGSGRIYPQFVDELKDCRNWEITEEPINCDKKTAYHLIDNTTKKEELISDVKKSSTE